MNRPIKSIDKRIVRRNVMARINEQERLNELTKREREFWNAGIYPAGMDEVGRGPLAGPL